MKKMLQYMKKKHSENRLWAEINRMPQGNIRDEMIFVLQNQVKI